MKYYINGWRTNKNYFLSFGFTKEELDAMVNGAIITREQNKFFIIAE